MKCRESQVRSDNERDAPSEWNMICCLSKVLGDKDLDKQLQRIGTITSGCSSHWLLAALQQLDLCVPLEDSRVDQYYLFPNIIESGGPSQDVWPDVPDWDERQITCTVLVRTIKPGAFLNLVRRINHEVRLQDTLVTTYRSHVTTYRNHVTM